MSIRVAVVDSHTLVRYGLRELVSGEQDIEIVAECGSAVEAPVLLATTRPDVVVLSSKLPDRDGLELAQELRASRPDVGIVILSPRGGGDVLLRALATGVSAFVTTSAPTAEMLAAIRHSAVATSSFTATGLAELLNRGRDTADRMVLSSREMDVLSLLSDGLSVPAIATQMYISYSTAKTYVARIYTKLGAANRSQALITAIQQGLIG